MKKYYFTYGSNLNLDDDKTKCVCENSFKPYKIARLPDERLVFNFSSPSRDCDVLNIEESTGHNLEGYFFVVLSEDGWRTLDSKGEHPNYYCREMVIILEDYWQEIEALTYRAVPERISAFIASSGEYFFKFVVKGVSGSDCRLKSCN